MKKLSIIAATALLFFAGCGGGPSLSPEEQKVADSAKVFYESVGNADWKKACASASKDYLAGARNISSVLSRLTPKGLSKEPRKTAAKPCPEELEFLIVAQSPETPGSGYPSPEVKTVAIDGKTAEVTLLVSNRTFFGDKSGSGESETVFTMTRSGDSWKFAGNELVKSETDSGGPAGSAGQGLQIPAQATK